MRKLLALALALLLSSLPAFASFGSATQFNVSTSSGADTNGGAFDSGVGSPGTDESAGAGTAITITLTGTTTGTGSPAFSSTTHGPGNFVHIASGSGCTTGWYEVASQAVGVATFDHAMGTATNVCVGVIGGKLATIAQSTALCTSGGGNTVNIQSGTYTQTSTIDVGGCTTLDGYYTTAGDLDSTAWTNWTSANANFPLITTATNSTNLIKFSLNGSFRLQNLSLSNTASVRAEGTFTTAHTPKLVFVSTVMDGFTKAIDCDDGVNDDCYVTFNNSELKNASVYGIGSNAFPINIYGSNIHDNASTSSTYWVVGIIGSVMTIERSLITNNSGSDGGIQGSSSAAMHIHSSTFANNGATIFAATTGTFDVVNTIAYGNGTYGVQCNSTTGGQTLASNAYGANTSGATSGCGDNGSAAITLTADPFTSDSGSNRDYSLNSTAGGGALLKGLGVPAIFPGGATTAYSTVGAVDPNPSGGGSGSAVQTTVQY